MMRHTPEEYAALLLPCLTEQGWCTPELASDTYYYLKIDSATPFCPPCGTSTLQVEPEGCLTLKHVVDLDDLKRRYELEMDREDLLERINRSNDMTLGKVTFSLREDDTLCGMSGLYMDACSTASAERAAQELRMRMWRIATEMSNILEDLITGEAADGAEDEEIAFFDEEPEAEEQTDEETEQLYALLAWADLRGVNDMAIRNQRKLYRLLGTSVLQDEEWVQPIIGQLHEALPNAAPWPALDLPGEELPWDPAWGEEEAYLHMADRGDLSELSGHELMLANRALERNNIILKARMKALNGYRRTRSALMTYLAKKE